MAVSWAREIGEEFYCLDLGDPRRERRCRKIAVALAKHSDQSIPQACKSWSETKAAYRFFGNENVNREAILASPIEMTVTRCQAAQDVLAIHDTMYLDYSAHPMTAGLGLIGSDEWAQGLLVHNVLAVDRNGGRVLGLLHQEVWARKGHVPIGETQEERRKRARESQRWPRGIDAVERQGLKNIIHVADRESDIYEVLETAHQRKARYILRACKNRSLANETGYLMDAVRESSALGKMTISIPARPGQPKREAHLTVRRRLVTMRPPKALNRKGPDLPVQVVEAWEARPPRTVKAVRWVLLTTEPVATFEACVRVIQTYALRYRVEEFHMGLKTGCRVEDRQLETRGRLESFLGVASVISVMLLRLRDAARGEEKAAAYLTNEQLMILCKEFPNLDRHPTARDALRAVACVGGFLARKGDKEPGWRTIYRGYMTLLMWEHGFLLAKNRLNIDFPLDTCG